MKTKYKVKKREKHYHTINKLGWTAIICDKKESAQFAGNILNICDFDNIIDKKLAQKVHNFASFIGEYYDKH